MGIGKAVAEKLAAKGAKVVLNSRGATRLQATLEEMVAKGWAVHAVQADVGNLEGCQHIIAETIRHFGRIDLLINNAGILQHEQLGDIDYNTVTQQFLVNAQAPLLVTEALLRNLNEGSKIAFITSRMGSIADNTSGGYYGYRMSKAALNAAAKSLSIDLKPRGIAVGILHPGYVQTAMVNFGGDISAAESAKRLSKRIAELNLQNSGGFWHSNGDKLPW